MLKLYPFLQHSDIYHDIEEAFEQDQSLECCGQVKVETNISFQILFNSGCGDPPGVFLDIRDWVVVKPEQEGDQDDGEDEDDEETDGDGHQEAGHHVVGCVDLIKVD